MWSHANRITCPSNLARWLSGWFKSRQQALNQTKCREALSWNLLKLIGVMDEKREPCNDESSKTHTHAHAQSKPTYAQTLYTHTQVSAVGQKWQREWVVLARQASGAARTRREYGGRSAELSTRLYQQPSRNKPSPLPWKTRTRFYKIAAKCVFFLNLFNCLSLNTIYFWRLLCQIPTEIKRHWNCLRPFASMADWRWNCVCQTNVVKKKKQKHSSPNQQEIKEEKDIFGLCVILISTTRPKFLPPVVDASVKWKIELYFRQKTIKIKHTWGHAGPDSFSPWRAI